MSNVQLVKAEPLAQALQRFDRDRFNILLPESVRQPPMGWTIDLRVATVDIEHDTYRIPGGKGRGLSKRALNVIKGLAGVDTIESRRMDDRSDSSYAEFQVTIRWRDYGTGEYRQEKGTRALDLREGSPYFEQLQAIARKGNRDPMAQIQQMRSFIVEHAETKAQLRAIRAALALRTSYEERDLQRPFVVPMMILDEAALTDRQREMVMNRRIESALQLFPAREESADRADVIDVEAKIDPTSALPTGDQAQEPTASDVPTKDEIMALAKAAGLSGRELRQLAGGRSFDDLKAQDVIDLAHKIAMTAKDADDF